MKIRVGYELIYDFPQPTPMIMVLGAHPTRASDIIVSDALQTDPAVEITPYRDLYGNLCSRLVAPAGPAVGHPLVTILCRDVGHFALPSLPKAASSVSRDGPFAP
jgi:hypothetical protein